MRGFGIPFGRWFSFKVLTAETHFVRSVGLLCVSVRGFVPRPRPRCVSRTPVSVSVAAVGPEESFRQVGGGCCAGPLGNLTVTAGGPRGRTEDTQQIARVRQTPHGLQQRLTPGRCSNAYRKPWAWLPVKMVAAHTGQPRALRPCSGPSGDRFSSRFLLHLGACEFWAVLGVPGAGMEMGFWTVGGVPVLGEGPPDLDFLHPKVRQEHVPQSPVPLMGSEPTKDSKSPLAPQPRARLWREFPTSQGRRSVQVGGPGCSLTSAGSPLLCLSGAVPARGVSQGHDPHACVGSWAVLGILASPTLGCKEADQGWPGGQVRGRPCPVLAQCWLQQQKRGRLSGDTAGPGRQQGAGGPRLPAHALCAGHPLLCPSSHW